MRIINDIKLDFSDVLIQPKRSTLKSRKDVNLIRTFTLPHNKQLWKITPICAANMDTVGTFEMAKALGNYKCLVALHKHYPLEELVYFYKTMYEFDGKHAAPDNVFYSLGISESDLNKLELFESTFGTPTNVCIDVANGYT